MKGCLASVFMSKQYPCIYLHQLAKSGRVMGSYAATPKSNRVYPLHAYIFARISRMRISYQLISSRNLSNDRSKGESSSIYIGIEIGSRDIFV